MYLFSTFTPTLLILSGLALAAPAPAAPSSTVAPPALFKLHTQVVPGLDDRGTNKSHLWLYSYHTGAGLGDACLSSNKSYAMQAYLNGTQQLFTYPDNQIGGWPLNVGYEPYTLFSDVTISIAAARTPQQGYFYNETGLQLNESSGGWLVCDWWHGVPQLFNIVGPVPSAEQDAFPKTCSHVNLLPVAVQ